MGRVVEVTRVEGDTSYQDLWEPVLWVVEDTGEIFLVHHTPSAFGIDVHKWAECLVEEGRGMPGSTGQALGLLIRDVAFSDFVPFYWGPREGRG